VRVLHDHQTWRGLETELGEERGVERLAPDAVAERGPQRPGRLPRHVVHRAERAGRGERVAEPAQRTRPSLMEGHEALDEARLSGARLSRDGRDAPGAAGGVVAQAVQLPQDRFALEEVHVVPESVDGGVPAG
jgi:hypothetical protein